MLVSIQSGQFTPEATPEIGILHHTIVPATDNIVGDIFQGSFPRRARLLATPLSEGDVDQNNQNMLTSRASIATLAPSFHTPGGGSHGDMMMNMIDDSSLSDEDTMSVPEQVRQIGESILDSLRHLGESMQSLPDDIHVRTIERKRSEVFVGLEFREKSSPWNANGRTPPPRFLDHIEQDAEVQTDDVLDTVSSQMVEELHAENIRLMNVEQELQAVIGQLTNDLVNGEKVLSTREDALSDADQHLCAAEEELATLKALLESQQASTTANATDAAKQQQDAQTMIKALEAQIATHKLQLDIKASENHELKHDLAQAVITREAMQNQLDRLQSQLDQQLAQVGVEQEQLVDKLNTSQERALQLERELGTMLTKLHEQKHASNQKDSTIEAQLEEIAELTTAFRAVKASFDDQLELMLEAQSLNVKNAQTMKEQKNKD